MATLLEVVCDGSSEVRPAVVAPPHPLYGGRMDNPVVLAVSEALAGAGYRVLRFNWRGVGASAGAASGRIEDAVADYRAALDEVSSKSGDASAGRHVLAAGYSFGAATACMVADEEDRLRIDRLVLVAPPVALLDLGDLSRLERPVQVIVGERDQYAPLERVAELAGSPGRDGLVRIDVIPDADHFFSMPFWIQRVGELVAAHS